MKFERIILLILVAAIVVGGIWADGKIDKLQAKLDENHVDTVTVEIPLVELDTVYVEAADSIEHAAETTYVSGDTLIINNYPILYGSTTQPLFDLNVRADSRTKRFQYDFKYRNLGIHLEFPDKFDFRKVQVTTIPPLGELTISLNNDYKPHKPKKGFGLWLGGGYVPAKENGALFISGGLMWKKNYVGALRSETGWGITVNRMLWGF